MDTPVTVASAPGKIILFGEHAVVYGRPAIAVPVTQIRATATVETVAGDDVLIAAPDLGVEMRLSDASPDDALAAALRQLAAFAPDARLSGLRVTVRSEIPIASGLGSGAAISVALLRALGAQAGLSDRLTPEVVSRLAYEVEKLYHGTPSGIDNTVVAYEQPVYFRRAEPANHIEVFHPHHSLLFLIADTGIRSATRDVVGDVRRQWQQATQQFERIFDACGEIAAAARPAIVTGDLASLGELMNKNQRWLVEMTVSSPELDRLVAAARAAGALGAKLSGGGRGGNMIALVTGDTRDQVRRSLLRAGAVRVLESRIGQVSAAKAGEAAGGGEL